MVGLLWLKQPECVLPARPELKFPIVRILVHILLDRYRAVRRCLGEFRIDLVTSGWTRRLRGGRADDPDADTALNEQADQRCSNLHFLAPLTQSRAHGRAARWRPGWPICRRVGSAWRPASARITSVAR